jgi:DNA (cytosine-5)-methyltransferase 1
MERGQAHKRETMKAMNFLDLFSGIGGFALGAYWAGTRFEHHYYSEVDPYAIKVYQARFPDAIGLGDIRNIRGAGLPGGEWIIAGGFPCQDISVAGKGAGISGARSGLWYEYARIIGELRPRYAIMENVGALVSRGLDSVLGSLAEIGYDAEWQDIRASDVGAPHRRERIWIVAYPDAGDAERRQGERSRIWKQESGEGANDNPGRSGKAYVPQQALADASDGGNVRRDGELEPAESEVREHRGSPQDGCGEWWAVEPGVGRLAHGVPARVDRLKCLGNSIVPQIAEMIFRELEEFRQATLAHVSGEIPDKDHA